MMKRYGRSGWFNESYRHYLARRGVSTARYKPTRSERKREKKQEMLEQYRREFSEFYREDMNRHNPEITRKWAKFRLRPKGEFIPKTFDRQKFDDRVVVEGVAKDSRFPEKHEVWLKRSKYWKKKATCLPIHADKLEEGTIYPISPEEVDALLKNMKDNDLKGIKGVEFVPPKGEQQGAWAQYIRSTKKIKIFAQSVEGGRIDGWDPKELNRHIKEYVIPHEVGHHKALRGGKTDQDLEMAEARADANVAGMDPFDKDVKRLVDGKKA